jgi:hypothetical protein
MQSQTAVRNLSNGEVPNIVWDEDAQQWLASHEHEGQLVLHQHFALINDAIAAIKRASGASDSRVHK